VVRKRSLHLFLHAPDEYGRRNALPSSVSALGAGPYYHGLLLGDTRGEFSVHCMCKRMLFHPIRGFVERDVDLDESRTGDEFQAGKQSRNLDPSIRIFLPSGDALKAGQRFLQAFP